MLETMDKRALGEKIRRLRAKADLSQEELAGRAKIAHRALQRVESGKANPTVDTLTAIAKALGVPFEELAGISGRETFINNEVKRSQTDPALLEAAKVLQALASAGPFRRALVKYMLFQDPAYLENLPEIGPIQKLLA